MPKTNTVASWHFDTDLKPTAAQVQGEYQLIPAGSTDVDRVNQLYQRTPVPGMDLKSVNIIYNPGMNREFALKMKRLNQREGKPAFSADWKKGTGKAFESRQAVHEIFKALTSGYADPSYPHVSLVPMWHGTKQELLGDIFETGFANLAKTDSGFFGKGIYSTGDAEYAYRVYSKGALLVNWVAVYSAFPVIHGDLSLLQAKGNHENYDGHFIPVKPQNPNHPHEVCYYPCDFVEGNLESHTYTELVVFESSQCLPRYSVELQPSLPKTPSMASPGLGQGDGALDLDTFVSDVLMDYEDSVTGPQLKSNLNDLINRLLEEDNRVLTSDESNLYRFIGRAQGEVNPKRQKALETKINKLVMKLLSATPSAAPASPAPVLPAGGYGSLFQPVSETPKQTWKVAGVKPSDVEKVLRLVAEGEQDEAEGMLKQQPALALCKGRVTDLSGRQFKEITVFQYAAWALDAHMWTMILKYLPGPEAAVQLNDLKEHRTEHGSHADWRPLIKALGDHVELVNRWWGVDKKLPAGQRKYYKDFDDYVAKNEAHWCKTVGGHQKHLPAHVINEYCRSDRSFYPTPNFDEATLPRTRQTDEGEWFTATYNGGRLGDRWGALRAGYRQRALCLYRQPSYGLPSRYHNSDKQALQGLYSKRVEQLEQLEARLTNSHSNTRGAARP